MSEEFKIEIENTLNCYVCFDETNKISPCDCKANICDICFKKILKNNGKKCTICKKEYENIKELIEEELEELENLENVVINRRNMSYLENTKFLLCMLIIFLLTPLFGLLFKLLIGFGKINYFSIYSFLFGLIIWLIIILFANLIFALIKSVNYIIEEINNLIIRINSF